MCIRDSFKPADYGIDVPTARHMDLYTQFAMGAAHQAAADSGIVGTVAPERLGVYMGSGIGGMHTFVTETEKLLKRGPARVSPFFIPMMIDVYKRQVLTPTTSNGSRMSPATAPVPGAKAGTPFMLSLIHI